MMAEPCSDVGESTEHDESQETEVKVPNWKKYDEDIHQLDASIKAVESATKALNIRSDESTLTELAVIRSEKETSFKHFQNAKVELGTLNSLIQKKMGELTKIQGKLTYRNEDRINEAIRRLEHQLKTTNFKLSDEKKIVSELDGLKRSKKSLGTFLDMKTEMDGLRERQRQLREEKDKHYQSANMLKSKEEQVKQSMRSNKIKAEELKKELNELHEKKREVTRQFKTGEKVYSAYMAAKRKFSKKVEKRRKEEDKMMKQMQNDNEFAEYDRYQNDILLCGTLTLYLEKFCTAASSDDHEKEAESEHHTKAPDNVEGMYMLKKKEEILFDGIVRTKTHRKTRKDKRKSLTVRGSLTHTPEVFSQFASLGLSAPATMKEIPAILEALENKKLMLTTAQRSSATMDVQPEESCGPESGDACSIGAPSLAESALCDSILSTPEALLEAPRFPLNATYRGSRDSGLDEDQEQNDVEEGDNVTDKSSQSTETLAESDLPEHNCSADAQTD